MLRFVLQKLFNRRWMAICLLIGNLLIIAVAASNPTYADAVLQRTLTKTLSEAFEEKNVHPAQINMKTTMVTATEDALADYRQVLEAHRELPGELGIPVQLFVEEHSVDLPRAVRVSERTDGGATISVGYLADFQNNSELIAGSFPSDTVTDGVIEAVVSERLVTQLDLIVGEGFTHSKLQQENGEPYLIKVVGVFRAKQGSELFWSRNGTVLSSSLIISPVIFEDLCVADGTYPLGVSSRCTVYLDYTAIDHNQVENIIATIGVFNGKFIKNTRTSIYENLTSLLSAFQPEATRLKGTLTVLQVPIFVLLAAFLFMVSKQMMEMEENEIAVLKSRGSKKIQILCIYTLQAVLLALAGFLLGYPLSYVICNMLGASNAFMEFVQRAALPIRLTGTSLVYGLIAALAAVIVMTLPVLRYTGMSIVQHKVRKHGTSATPMWQKFFLDVILLAVSLYLLYNFNGQKELLAQRMSLGEPLDPLLYFSSSVFILGAGLLGIRLIPLIVKLIYTIGKKHWAPPIYTAFLRVLRTTKNQSFIMIFLVMTIALGIFNTASARSINGNAEAEKAYLNGADVVVREFWEIQLSGSAKTYGDLSNYQEPSFEKYRDIEGVESLTKVFRTTAASLPSVSGISGASDVVLMGIDTKEFGETAIFDESLLTTHWYEHLNALARDPDGVLVSSVLQASGMKLGDTLKYEYGGVYIQGVIAGFVDYWPGFVGTTMTKDGQVPNYLIVANLSQLQSQMGVQPYEIWMSLEDSSQCIYDFAEETNTRYAVFKDNAADLIAMKNEPVLQGTNGVLTSNFIIVLLLCAVGFLIYWILSIRSRELQFGIFRAMGMSMKEVIVMLVCEQILISGSSIFVGVAAGNLVTQLYLPLIQLAYSGSNQILPIRMITYTSDSIRLFVIIALMIVICMAVLAWLISKIKIAQALKLGED